MNKSFLQLISEKMVFLVEKSIINRKLIIFIKFVLIREVVWHTVCIMVIVNKK